MRRKFPYDYEPRDGLPGNNDGVFRQMLFLGREGAEPCSRGPTITCGEKSPRHGAHGMGGSGNEVARLLEASVFWPSCPLLPLYFSEMKAGVAWGLG